MQKKFKIEVDCANCAAKIEDAVKKLPGVNSASVSFMAQRWFWMSMMISSMPC